MHAEAHSYDLDDAFDKEYGRQTVPYVVQVLIPLRDVRFTVESAVVVFDAEVDGVDENHDGDEVVEVGPRGQPHECFSDGGGVPKDAQTRLVVVDRLLTMIAELSSFECQKAALNQCLGVGCFLFPPLSSPLAFLQDGLHLFHALIPGLLFVFTVNWIGSIGV